MTDNTIAPPHIQIGNDKLAQRLFWEAQRALRSSVAADLAKGIGRRVEPGGLDIVALVKGGGLTTKAQDGRGDPCRWGEHEIRVHIGGKNAGCSLADCSCSVPVYRCRFCNDCDYGWNTEAEEIREECETARNAQ